MIAALLAAAAFSPFFAGIDQGIRQGIRSWGPLPCDVVAINLYWAPRRDGQLEAANSARNRRYCVMAWNINALRDLNGGDVCMFAWHEDGHFYNLGHSPNRRSIMHTPVPHRPHRGLCKR